MDVERGRATQEDTIFRMASSSKPVLGVAAMMMIEEGLLHPSDEVATHLPRFNYVRTAAIWPPSCSDWSGRIYDALN